jgi:hypothetical protein
MSEHRDTPKVHEPHTIHEEHAKGPHDPKEINPKMASDIAYRSKEFGVTAARPPATGGPQRLPMKKVGIMRHDGRYPAFDHGRCLAAANAIARWRNKTPRCR